MISILKKPFLGLLIGLIFQSIDAWAMPKSFEIWFLSPEQASAALEKGFQKKTKFLSVSAQANLQCQPMGEYCFDPQVGMYKPSGKSGGGSNVESFSADYREADKLEKYDYESKSMAAQDKDFVCDKDNLFDFFCSSGSSKNGAAKKVKEQAKFEIWFDISSSMKQVDFSGYDKMCQRESFLRLLARDCGFNSEMQIHGFNEAKKQLGTIDSVCLNHGLNSRDRIIRDIKASSAKKLIVITDIFEADETLINFVEVSGGKAVGVEKPMYASDLKAQARDLRKKCL